MRPRNETLRGLIFFFRRVLRVPLPYTEPAKRMGLTQSQQSRQSFLVPRDVLWSASTADIRPWMMEGSGFHDQTPPRKT
jgi:hypothetical protein